MLQREMRSSFSCSSMFDGFTYSNGVVSAVPVKSARRRGESNRVISVLRASGREQPRHFGSSSAVFAGAPPCSGDLHQEPPHTFVMFGRFVKMILVVQT